MLHAFRKQLAPRPHADAFPPQQFARPALHNSSCTNDRTTLPGRTATSRRITTKLAVTWRLLLAYCDDAANRRTKRIIAAPSPQESPSFAASSLPANQTLNGRQAVSRVFPEAPPTPTPPITTPKPRTHLSLIARAPKTKSISWNTSTYGTGTHRETRAACSRRISRATHGEPHKLKRNKK